MTDPRILGRIFNAGQHLVFYMHRMRRHQWQLQRFLIAGTVREGDDSCRSYSTKTSILD
jgi:hypothetical protein